MGLDVDTNSVTSELQRLARANRNVETKAMKTVAQKVADQLSVNTPLGRYNDAHLREHIVVGTPKDGEIQVGYDKEVSWRVHFAELGTIKQRPQNFVQRTAESMQQDIISMLEEEIRRGLGL
ncbi:HK97 gp10 family phage protein [Fictibacillus macauensis ZFHKF-1]|uniref:HK97 gp10 family phage protein n=1 Tax=Fictibacillus macauensis ZFHKF-1 TaxID=1196324 RepID=I8UG82_9BACL|nr:HK97-gp10 family putative phage morphogenesis protein [Fictibacillus macauensis]EIT85910.1 HK97 gp10 family phage protein [Fictibacillus macauensis ZFHKF-1]